MGSWGQTVGDKQFKSHEWTICCHVLWPHLTIGLLVWSVWFGRSHIYVVIRGHRRQGFIVLSKTDIKPRVIRDRGEILLHTSRQELEQEIGLQPRALGKLSKRGQWLSIDFVVLVGNRAQTHANLLNGDNIYLVDHWTSKHRNRLGGGLGGPC